jgi:phosphoribosyl-ATP pyrophosphohydrolase
MTLGVYHGVWRFKQKKPEPTSTAALVSETGVTAPVIIKKFPEEARTALAAAEKLYKKGLFAEAKDKYLDAEGIIKSHDFTGHELYLVAAKGANRAYVFDLIIAPSRISRNDLADAKELFRFKIKGEPEPVIGKIRNPEGDGQKHITIVSRDSTKEYKKSDIVSREPVPVADFKKMLEKELDKNLKNAKDVMGIYYLGVFFAVRYGLDYRVTDLLERIFSDEKSGWEYAVPYMLEGEDVEEIKERVNIGFGRKHFREIAEVPSGNRRSSFVPPRRGNERADPKEDTDTADTGDKPQPVFRPIVLAGDSAIANALIKADDLRRRGMELYNNKEERSSRAYFDKLSRALVYLKQARDIYNQLLDRASNSREIEHRLREVGQTIFWIVREVPAIMPDK